MLLLNPSPTRVATHFLRMVRILLLKNALMGTVHLQEFIALKLRKEEGTVAMKKRRSILSSKANLHKMEKPLLILMRMVDSNQPHMDKLRFMVLMVDYHIRMSTPKLENKNYFPPIPELEDDEYK